MARFVIINTLVSTVRESRLFSDVVARGERRDVPVDCAWLVEAVAAVDDPESAMRAAIAEFFSGEEGARVRAGEGLDRLRWCDAIPWIPDEVWERHGLTVFRYPEVERILLDSEEDLAEELSVAASR